MIELRARACPPTWKPRTSRGFSLQRVGHDLFLDFDVSYSKLQNERLRGGLKFIKIKSVRRKILSRRLVIYAKDSNEFLWIGGNREYETRDKCIEERDDRLLSEKEERRRVYKREKGE